jgi:hypothetical protein
MIKTRIESLCPYVYKSKEERKNALLDGFERKKKEDVILHHYQ